MLLQIMLLSGVLEDNGVDPAAILSSAGVGAGRSSEDSSDEEEGNEEEDSEEEASASVASTAEDGAQSPGKDGDWA